SKKGCQSLPHAEWIDQRAVQVKRKDFYFGHVLTASVVTRSQRWHAGAQSGIGRFRCRQVAPESYAAAGVGLLNAAILQARSCRRREQALDEHDFGRAPALSAQRGKRGALLEDLDALPIQASLIFTPSGRGNATAYRSRHHSVRASENGNRSCWPAGICS